MNSRFSTRKGPYFWNSWLKFEPKICRPLLTAHIRTVNTTLIVRIGFYLYRYFLQSRLLKSKNFSTTWSMFTAGTTSTLPVTWAARPWVQHWSSWFLTWRTTCSTIVSTSTGSAYGTTISSYFRETMKSTWKRTPCAIRFHGLLPVTITGKSLKYIAGISLQCSGEKSYWCQKWFWDMGV